MPLLVLVGTILILFGNVLVETRLQSLTPELVVTKSLMKVFGAKGSGFDQEFPWLAKFP